MDKIKWIPLKLQKTDEGCCTHKRKLFWWVVGIVAQVCVQHGFISGDLHWIFLSLTSCTSTLLIWPFIFILVLRTLSIYRTLCYKKVHYIFVRNFIKFIRITLWYTYTSQRLNKRHPTFKAWMFYESFSIWVILKQPEANPVTKVICTCNLTHF